MGGHGDGGLDQSQPGHWGKVYGELGGKQEMAVWQQEGGGLRPVPGEDFDYDYKLWPATQANFSLLRRALPLTELFTLFYFILCHF